MDRARRTDLVPSRPLNYSNITNSSYCLGISSEHVKTLNLTLICVCSTAGISCVLAIIFILVSKRYKKFVYRLTLYLMVAILLVEVALFLRQCLCTTMALLWPWEKVLRSSVLLLVSCFRLQLGWKCLSFFGSHFIFLQFWCSAAMSLLPHGSKKSLDSLQC